MKYTHSVERGQRAEERFMKALQGGRFAERSEDMFSHWDIEDDLGVRYDVKAMKRLRRSDDQADDSIHYVELRNVNGELGWLYGGADFIVFETRRYWIVVKRRTLMFYIEEKTENSEQSLSPSVYKLYQRNGRKDLMTVAPTVDLLAISETTIKK
jgi:hypothetical protein